MTAYIIHIIMHVNCMHTFVCDINLGHYLIILSVLLVAVLGGDATYFAIRLFLFMKYSHLQLPFMIMMCILINYYNTMHTTHISEMMDDASISLKYDLGALVVMTI